MAMKRVVGVLFLFAVVLASAVLAEDVQLAPNATASVDVPDGVAKIMVSNPGVADAVPGESGKSVLLSGVKEGSTDVRVKTLKGNEIVYKVTVAPDMSSFAKQIAGLLGGIEGVQVKTIGDRVVIDGNVLTMSDYNRAKAVAEAYSDRTLFLATIDRKDLNEFVAKAIENDIGLDTVSVRVMGETATLEGAVYDEGDIARAVEMAKQRVPNVVNLLRVEEVMIETDVYFVQVDKSKSKDIGDNLLENLSLSASGTISGGNDAGTISTFSASGQITARIRALVGKGDAKILAQPHLSTKSGGEGHFHSGGQEFFEVSGVNAGSLEQIEHGVLMTVKPTLRGKDRIMNEVSIEVSVPVSSSRGAFSLDKFETSSTVMCNVGESIIISGLAETLESRFKEHTPLLGRIPIFNLFFSEKSESSSERELLVVLTPRPVFPTRRGQPSLSEERMKLLKENE